MDTFDELSLECFIQASKDQIIDKLNKLNLNSQSLSSCNTKDWLCMVLDQTPNMIEDIEPSIKYHIPQLDDTNSNDQLKTSSSINLDLDPKQQSKLSSSVSSSQNKSNVNDNDNNIKGNGNNKAKSKQEDNITDIDHKHIQGQLIEDSIKDVMNNKKPSFLSNGRIRVYLFHTNNYIDIDVTQDDSFRIIKKKAYAKLLNSVNLINQLRDAEGYEFVALEEDNIENDTPKYTTLLIKDTQKVYRYGKDTIGLIEKADYNTTSKSLLEKAKLNVVGNVISKSEASKVNLRIHLKIEEAHSYSTVIQANSEDTLKTIIEKTRSRLRLKNIDYYYFVEHSPYFDNEDIENALSFDLQLKYLLTYEIDLFMKKYPDIPELYNSIRQPKSPFNKDLIGDKKKLLVSDIDQHVNYNDISAAAYEEFDVIKINKFQTKQERTLGIDLYNLYNEVPKKSRSIQFLGIGKTKQPLRKISDIHTCEKVGDNSFFIDANENGSVRRLIFETKNSNLRNQIVSKLNYLLKMTHKKYV